MNSRPCCGMPSRATSRMETSPASFADYLEMDRDELAKNLFERESRHAEQPTVRVFSRRPCLAAFFFCGDDVCAAADDTVCAEPRSGAGVQGGHARRKAAQCGGLPRQSDSAEFLGHMVRAMPLGNSGPRRTAE